MNLNAGFSILLNTGSGTFLPSLDYVTPGGSNSIATADFNGDSGLRFSCSQRDSRSNEAQHAVGVLEFAGDRDFPERASIWQSGGWGLRGLGDYSKQLGERYVEHLEHCGSGAFTEGNNCGNSLPPGGICTLGVTFKPTEKGTYNGKLIFKDSASTGQQTVALSGTGVQPIVKFSVTSLAFGNHRVGTTDVSKPVTLTNTGNEALTIKNIAITGADAGDFSQTNNCGSSLLPGKSCTIFRKLPPQGKGDQNRCSLLK